MPKKETDYVISGLINCVALVSGFLNLVVWQCLVLISLRYSLIDFQGWISKKGNWSCNVRFRIQWQISKNGNSALRTCHFGKCLLTVGGDEQQEMAISPLILIIFVALFLEHVPYMYMDLSTMLECKKCNWFLSECNMSCSLLTTVRSKKWQYLHQYWLFLWRFFWYLPIRQMGRYLECQSANSIYQSCHTQNWCAHCLPWWAAISLPKQDLSVALFWILISYDNRASFTVSGSRLPCWLMCHFQFHDKSLNMIQKEWLTGWHVKKNGTFHLILPRDPLLTPSQCLSLLCVIPNQKKRHRKILFWQRYGCSLWQTVSMQILCVAWLVNTICTLTLQIPSHLPNGEIPKKAPQK